MNNNDNDIKSLNGEIQIIQLEKMFKEWDKDINKMKKKSIIKIALVLGLTITTFTLFLIFKNPYIVIAGTFIAGGSNILSFFKESKKIDKNDPDLSNQKIELTDKAFYSEQYQKSLAKRMAHVESKEEKKYNEALKKQQSHIKVLEVKQYLTKEETMIKIVSDLNIYNKAYVMPPIKIKEKEWDIFFELAYEYMTYKHMENKFYEIMSQISRFVYASALINSASIITIEDFINSLSYLPDGITNFCTKEEIALLQKEIRSEIPTKKVINLSNYQLKKIK